MIWCLQFSYGLILVMYASGTCNRKPLGASGDRSPVDENYQILIDGNPSAYLPGQQYKLTLSCGNGLKFISFTLVVESENDPISGGFDMLGHLEIIDTAETKFSATCENMVESSNINSKTRAELAWIAPTNPESGCLLIKAAVLQHRNVWFIDDGFLTKRICPEEIDEINSQILPMDPCCACDEAKYEIILERKWSRNTHATDFPSEAWRTRFSEVIGASHTFKYRFWEYGARASSGLQELAEHGATRNLEEEIKANIKSGNIRTIIKAPGIMFRANIMGTTLATVRVDAIHHIISLVTKIEPSPDWILGVAGLELCLANCTWIDRKILNLYPWDVGTDGGPSYMSPDQPQVPPDVVRRITSTFPSDFRSPFYDEEGVPMKPLATLYLIKRKLYERVCNGADPDQNHLVECATHPWNNWNDCSAKCGPGIRRRARVYKDVKLAESYNCDVQLNQTQNCVGIQCGLSEETAAECETSPWSEWSDCSTKCGVGVSIRSKSFVNPFAKEKCQSAVPFQLNQTRSCYGKYCGGTIKGSNMHDDLNSPFTNLSEFDDIDENSTGNRQTNWQTNNGRLVHQNRISTSQFSDLENKPVNNFNAIIYNKPAFDEKLGSNTIYARARNVELDGSVALERTHASHKFGTPTNQYNYNPSRNTFPSDHSYTIHQNGTITSSSTNRSPPTSNDSNFNYRDQNRYGLRDEFNNQRRITSEAKGTGINNNVAMHDYCFEKPYASLQPCRKKVLGLKNYWFYDADDRQCKLFAADNCDQNKNKFRSLDACESTCHNPRLNLEQTQENKIQGGDFEEPLSQIIPSYNGGQTPIDKMEGRNYRRV